ncbi:hypothetical protein [Luteolibacter sp. LG18]|uniref:PIN/TRAM domain-containing protein n=1 Tax=Luteolibacter sp. LG18 TaxID=2819286 RepID=UPI002B2D6605|nr:PIN/TRAM domain-containing protein [Luteolibacter sp. LG18]
MSSQPSVNVARLTYLLVCEAAGFAIALSTRGVERGVPMWMGLLGGLLVAGFFILVETMIRGFSLRGFSTATFGLCVGLFCAWLLTRVQFSALIEPAFRDKDRTPLEQAEFDLLVNTLKLAFDVTLFASFGFIGVVLALRSSRDDFAFIIPYVRFRQDASSGQPIVLDPEAVMDGRVPAILRAGFLHGRLIVPRFVLEELQTLAHSPSAAHRQRGERGLASLEQMRTAKDLQVTIHESNGAAANATLNSRLLETTRLLGARLMTSDDTLSKVAKLQNVPALNIQELVDALKPVVAVGERLRIALVRPGKEEHQAVGYLADGTMIVVNHAVQKIGSSVDVLVISTLQTSAGTMIFAEAA